MSELKINKSQAEGNPELTILHLNGQLDGSTEQQFLEQARQVQAGNATRLLVDLSELTILTSAGLRAIQLTLRLFTPHHDRELMGQHGEEPYKSPYFKLACPNPDIYYILNIAGFLHNIPIYSNLEEAINSFQ